MKLQEIFDQLRYGELSQVAIGGGAAGDVSVDDYPKLTAHIQLALTALYKRFALKEGRLIVELMPGQVLYQLKNDFAVNNEDSEEPLRYLIDDPDDPFSNDILKVERVLTSEGLDLALNDPADEYSVSTPKTLVLRVPEDIADQVADLPDWLQTDTLELVYRANHTALVPADGDIDPAIIEVDLPTSYLEPLLYYVASRVYNPIGIGQEFNSGNTWYAKYEAACQDLEAQNLQIDRGATYSRLSSRGFV